MASYPKYPILVDSDVSRVDGYDPRRATNGTLKVRKLMASEKRDFTLVHFLNKTDKDALEAFFQTNKELDVTLSWPGDASTYTVRFTSAPQYQQATGYLYRVTVRMSQV